MLARLITRSFSTTGHLLTWGQTTYGWGRPTSNDYWQPAFVPNISNVVSVSTGEHHLGFITSDHAVYTVGLTEDGRLGQGKATNSELPSRIAFDRPDLTITALSCGSRHSLALSADGEVYAWGYPGAVGQEGVKNADMPLKIPGEYFQNHKVVHVAAARDFSVALCDQGHLYAWGEGLLSLPEWEQKTLTPQPVKEVEHLLEKRHAKIKKFFAIDRFIILLLDNGRLYCRGINNGGVFGARTNPLILSDLQLSSFTRTHDELFKGEKVVDFECSSNSLIFRTESDKLFYSGMFVKYQPTPFPLQVKAKKLFASESSVGVVSEDNKLYYLNEKLIDDSDLICKTNRVFLCEDERFNSEILAVGGDYALRFALVK